LEIEMPLLALALAVGTAGMAMGADLTGSEWRPSFIVASELPGKTRMVVKFNPGGEITGNGGCNHFAGSYTISGNAIKIGPLMSTRMGCPGTIRLEGTFFGVLQAATTFEQDGTKLVLFDTAGTKLAQFVRSDED
jgi:heat shock protein HslJ